MGQNQLQWVMEKQNWSFFLTGKNFDEKKGSILTTLMVKDGGFDFCSDTPISLSVVQIL